MDISSAEYHAARKQRITSMIDVAGKGIEIGPSHNPAAPKSAGYNVEIVDHTDQQGLIEKYVNDVGVTLSNIEAVDHVWAGGSLSERVGNLGSYDWIIAAHVVEHMPDLIYFLQECEALLRPGGILSLVVPDKRFCFDHLRRRSTTGELIQAHLERRDRHTPGQVFDHFAHACKLDESGSWHRDSAGRLAFVHVESFARHMLDVSTHSAEYLDIHAWVFTPSSFRLIIYDLNSMGYIGLNEVSFTPTRDCEFFVVYEKAPSSSVVDRLELAKQAAHEERAAYFP